MASGLLMVCLAAWRAQVLHDQAKVRVAELLHVLADAHASVDGVHLSLERCTLMAHGIELELDGRKLMRAGELTAHGSCVSLWLGQFAWRQLELSAQSLELDAHDLNREYDLGLDEVTLSAKEWQIHLGPDYNVRMHTAHFAVRAGQMTMNVNEVLMLHRERPLVQARLEWKGELSPTPAAGTARLLNLRWQSAAVEQEKPLELVWQSDGQYVSVDGSYDFRQNEGKLTFMLRLSLADFQYELRLEPRAVRSGHVLELLSSSPPTLAALVDGTITLHGGLAPRVEPQGAVALQARTVGGTRAPSAANAAVPVGHGSGP